MNSRRQQKQQQKKNVFIEKEGNAHAADGNRMRRCRYVAQTWQLWYHIWIFFFFLHSNRSDPPPHLSSIQNVKLGKRHSNRSLMFDSFSISTVLSYVWWGISSCCCCKSLFFCFFFVFENNNNNHRRPKDARLCCTTFYFPNPARRSRHQQRCRRRDLFSLFLDKRIQKSPPRLRLMLCHRLREPSHK